jgi:hypothetical protein
VQDDSIGDRATAQPGKEVDSSRGACCPRSSSTHLSHGAGFDWLRTLVLNIALANSFAFASCGGRETRDRLARS